MNTAIAVREQEDLGQWQVIREQAAILVKSGFLPQSIKTPEQALAIILTGRELGIGQMSALNNINVIAGKPTVSPQLMLALINSKGLLEDMAISDDGQACTVTMKRRGRQPHSESFSMKDAALMKTTEGYGDNKKTISLSEKYNWRQMPAVMRKWRAVAACARVVFPDVILGLYTPDEMGATVNEEGEVVDLPVETEPTPAEQWIQQTTEPERPADITPEFSDAMAELRNLNRRLGFEDKALVKWLTKQFGLTEGLDINKALLSLAMSELLDVIDRFSQKVEEKEAA